jgi:hypothetical protein
VAGALPQSQYDGGDARHQQNDRRHLRRIRVAGEEFHAKRARIRIVLREHRRGAEPDTAQVPHHDDIDHREHDEARDRNRQRPVADEFPAQLVDVDVEHHDHEQEQHHDGADIHQHQHYPQEFGIQQHPDDGAIEEAQHQQQRRVHRIARQNHSQRRCDQHRGE